ncbi:hypothetical protein GGD83_000388 [Rhodoblastus sphagnicola]|nr:hypothetical protein [Rhodoblastus sphagnicola]MBB4196617.1 hypothetical protein [Rhodoblastus sphagnicola]
MVCIGGYPRVIVDSFAEAAAQASEMSWRHPDGDFTVYEIETGIHFDLPCGSRLDDGYMALLRLLADDTQRMG